MDLNGFVVVRGALTAAEVDAANAAVDAHAEGFVERVEPDLRNTTPEARELPHRVLRRRLYAHTSNHPFCL